MKHELQKIYKLFNIQYKKFKYNFYYASFFRYLKELTYFGILYKSLYNFF